MAALHYALSILNPFSISALLLTLVLLFAFQGKAIVEQSLIIVMLAVTIIIQVYFNLLGMIPRGLPRLCL